MNVMKKICLFAAMLLLVASLFACGRRQDILNQIESEKAAESAAEESNVVTMGGGRETVAPEPDTQKQDNPVDTTNPDNPADTTSQETYKPPVPTVPDPNDPYPNNSGYQLTAGINKGGNGYYNGVTVEELEQKFDCFIDRNVFHVNTPTGMIFLAGYEREKTTYYNKLTGNVTHICPDPLCRHKDDCIWAKMEGLKYVSDTHIYFVADDHLYRSDLNRNHVEDLGLAMETSGNRIVYVDGDLLYMQMLLYKPDSTAIFGFGVFDCKTKEFTTVYDEEFIYTVAVTGGDTVWFYYHLDSSTIYKTDLNFSYQEKVLTSESAMRVQMANEEYLLIGEGDMLAASYLYHIETGEKIYLPKGLHTSSYPTLNSKYLYYSKDMTEEEKAISPMKDYYNYVAPDGNFRAGLFTGDGRIYRLNLETGEEELCAEISYNGVPIRILEIVADGDAIYISYLTYKDFHNYYNQKYGSNHWDGSVDYYQHEPSRYLYIDMTNGTVNLIDPNRIG